MQCVNLTDDELWRRIAQNTTLVSALVYRRIELDAGNTRNDIIRYRTIGRPRYVPACAAQTSGFVAMVQCGKRERRQVSMWFTPCATASRSTASAAS